MLREGRSGLSGFMRDGLIGACMIEEWVGDSGAGLICGDVLAPLGGAGNDADIWLDGNAAIVSVSCAAGSGPSSSGRTGTERSCSSAGCGPMSDDCCSMDIMV